MLWDEHVVCVDKEAQGGGALVECGILQGSSRHTADICQEMPGAVVARIVLHVSKPLSVVPAQIQLQLQLRIVSTLFDVKCNCD